MTAAACRATMFVGGRDVRRRASLIIGSSRDISRRLAGVLSLSRGCYCAAVVAIACHVAAGSIGCACRARTCRCVSSSSRATDTSRDLPRRTHALATSPCSASARCWSVRRARSSAARAWWRCAIRRCAGRASTQRDRRRRSTRCSTAQLILASYGGCAHLCLIWQVLDYAMQQYRLLPLLATSYVLNWTGMVMNESIAKLQASGSSG